VRQEISSKGLSRSHIMILDALLKLRQVCCDPRTLSLNQAKNVKQSAKMDLLMDMVPEMIEEGRRILIFSQFTRMLSLIEDEFNAAGIKYCLLTGQTRKRDEQVDLFQSGEVPVFLISLKAGGVGLNLTAADTVIHYDPWWNPAAENQATDRAHRIGQDKPVFVYKLIAEDTIEDRILTLQQSKQALADSIYDEAGTTSSQLTPDDLKELFRPIEDEG
jgi:SNF2 family DNA or RNA helicase